MVEIHMDIFIQKYFMCNSEGNYNHEKSGTPYKGSCIYIIYIHSE